MVQWVTNVDNALVAAIDELVASGLFASRSEAVRAGMKRIVDDSRRATIGGSILAGYERMPDSDDELDLARRLTIAMIAEEPW